MKINPNDFYLITWADFILALEGHYDGERKKMELARAVTYKICEYSFNRPKKMQAINDFWKIDQQIEDKAEMTRALKNINEAWQNLK